MNWYVSTGGEPIGPLSEGQVVDMLRAGTRLVSVIHEGQETWMRPGDHPAFAAAIGAPLSTAQPLSQPRGPDETLGILALVVPVTAGGATWLMSATSQGDGFLLINIATVVVTAVLVTIEAARVGSGGKQDRVGLHPAMWFIAVAVLWIVGFPAWFKARAAYGLPNRLVAAVVVMIVYLSGSAAPFIFAELRSRAINLATVQRVEARERAGSEAELVAAKMADEVARYEHDRSTVRQKRPSTESELTTIIGRRPDNIIESPQMTFLQWFYDTKPIGRDIIQATLQNGRVVMMNY